MFEFFYDKIWWYKLLWIDFFVLYIFFICIFYRSCLFWFVINGFNEFDIIFNYYFLN